MHVYDLPKDLHIIHYNQPVQVYDLPTDLPVLHNDQPVQVYDLPMDLPMLHIDQLHMEDYDLPYLSTYLWYILTN